MKRFWKIAPWLTRIILLPPTAIFALIAIRYISHPVSSAAAQASFSRPDWASQSLVLDWEVFPLAVPFSWLLACSRGEGYLLA